MTIFINNKINKKANSSKFKISKLITKVIKIQVIMDNKYRKNKMAYKIKFLVTSNKQ